MFINRASGIQFQVAGVGKLWRGARSSLSGLDLVFGCAANSRCHFLQEYVFASTKIAYISEIRFNTRYITKETSQGRCWRSSLTNLRVLLLLVTDYKK
jgi:hypothetical protein